jgi:hypothetical protein
MGRTRKQKEENQWRLRQASTLRHADILLRIGQRLTDETEQKAINVVVCQSVMHLVNETLGDGRRVDDELK